MNFKDIRYLLTQSFKEWQEDKASRLAAALAYYTIFSLPPLLILSLAIAGQFYDRQSVQEKVLAQTSSLVGSVGADAIDQMLENASDPETSGLAAVISIVTLILGASGVFTQLKDAMDTIWEVQPKPGRGIVNAIKNRFFSFTMVLVVGFLLLVSLIISAGLAAVSVTLNSLTGDVEIVAQVVDFVISFIAITFFFALIYKVVPHVKIQWRDVWLGAAVTAVLFNVGKWAIGFYLGRSAPASTYGAAGSLIVLLIWIYYSAQILFLGAEFTQVYANRFGAKIVADDKAVPLTEKARVNQGIPHEETREQKQKEAAVSEQQNNKRRNHE